MYQIMLSILAITLSSCSSINNYFTEYAELRNESDSSKSEFIKYHSLTQDEYDQWFKLMSTKSIEIQKLLGAKEPKWMNGNQIALNSQRIIEIPELKNNSIQSVLPLENQSGYYKMVIFASNGVYAVHDYYSSNTIEFSCNFYNFESLSYAYVYETLKPDKGSIPSFWRELDKNDLLYEASFDFLSELKERKKAEKKHVLEAKLAEKKASIQSEAPKVISDIGKRDIHALKLRELYLGMPAQECAILLNYYKDLPSDMLPEYYTYDTEQDCIILFDPSRDIASSSGFETKNGLVSEFIFNESEVNKIFNASSLTAQEFGQALVSKFPQISSLQYAQLDEQIQIYGWKYTDPKVGFRISLYENKILVLKSIAKSSDLTF